MFLNSNRISVLHKFMAGMYFFVKNHIFSWSASNQLPVHYSSTGIHGPSNASSIGVCVKPIHFKYNKTLEILQFIELNMILGVTG